MQEHMRNRRYSCLLLFLNLALLPADSMAESIDSLVSRGQITHRIEAEALPSMILHTHEFLQGGNFEKRTMNHDMGLKLTYAFRKPRNEAEAYIYHDNYQGIGVAYHNFNPQLGNPFSAFIFQGARITGITRRLSLNYEWNLGLTFGWHPYDEENNKENRVIGSKVTAYINADIFLAYRISKQLDLNVGASLSHFSNGNTKLPNSGLNTLGARFGIAYYLNRTDSPRSRRVPIPPFVKYVSYDLMLYGAWCRNGFLTEEGEPVILPGRYGVFGFCFAPMYNMSHWLNVGVSLDGEYNSSANFVEDDSPREAGRHYNAEDILVRPPGYKQMTLGLSGHAEFVMPYFTINLGIGHNIVNTRRDFSGFYQMASLKIGLARNVFLNIGYTLRNFQKPNHLMLGIGFRFNHKRNTL